MAVSSSKTSISPIEDPHSPYFIHQSDSHASVVINPKLTSANCAFWSRSFLLALAIHNKAGFVDGSIGEPKPTNEMFGYWSRCNNLILAWLFESLSPEIASTVFYMNFA
ncbi:Uncharacterized protein TCM_017206 [Theobroma cacao]|uniref:Retrotransposon Copia-like N-terminal domain-containing protein n=1 Tax=Theobroma cacao TaxID=3641 RepID=A0A061EEI2_THECC|nr:Uncharacterized protein TCM_017206 [Theobroma cacao]